MAKRANNEGSLYFDKNKKIWRAMITTPSGNRLTKTNKNKDIVQDWLNKQRLLVGRGQHIEPNSITLGQWKDEWLETYAKIKVKPRTYDRYKSLLAHIEPLYNIKLKELTLAPVQRHINGLLDIYAPLTITHIINCLSGCLQQAVTNGLIYKNIAREIIKPKNTRKEITIFTEKEKRLLLEECEKYRNALIIPLAMGTGLRLSEVLALRCEDIKNNRLTINQTVHNSMSNGIYFSDTKTTSSHRTLLISSDLMQKIKEHKLKYGIREGLLFLNSRGTVENQDTYSKKVFTKIQKATGITKGFHTFRHTHATELLAADIPVHDVSRRLGHANVTTTLNVYTYFMPNSDERILKVLAEKK